MGWPARRRIREAVRSVGWLETVGAVPREVPPLDETMFTGTNDTATVKVTVLATADEREARDASRQLMAAGVWAAVARTPGPARYFLDTDGRTWRTAGPWTVVAHAPDAGRARDHLADGGGAPS